MPKQFNNIQRGNMLYHQLNDAFMLVTLHFLPHLRACSWATRKQMQQNNNLSQGPSVSVCFPYCRLQSFPLRAFKWCKLSRFGLEHRYARLSKSFPVASMNWKETSNRLYEYSRLLRLNGCVTSVSDPSHPHHIGNNAVWIPEWIHPTKSTTVENHLSTQARFWPRWHRHYNQKT